MKHVEAEGYMHDITKKLDSIWVFRTEFSSESDDLFTFYEDDVFELEDSRGDR